MNFVDTTLLRLADAGTRGALFDQLSLEHIAAAAYDLDAMPVDGPYQAVFEEVQLGFALPRVARLEGTWAGVGGREPVEARFDLVGAESGGASDVTAFWRGSIVARPTPANGVVSAVRTAWPRLGAIDDQIRAAMGALPADAAALEAARRAQLVADLKAAASDPDAITDALLGHWLEQIGAPSVGRLLADAGGSPLPGIVQVTYRPVDGGAPPTPRPLPLAAAVLIRDAGFSVSALLVESKRVRDELERLAVGRAVANDLRLRHPVVVVWVVPESVFDDDGWPGAAAGAAPAARRLARRTSAAAWLAREGIGIAVPA